MSTSTSLARLQQLLPQLFQESSPAGKAYLRFQLTPEIAAAISMEQVQESLLVPSEKISPLPNLPEAVIGIMSARDRIFCVVDLAQLVGLPSTSISARQYHTIVVRVAASQSGNGSLLAEEREFLLGIAVDRIQGLVRFDDDKIQPPDRDCSTQLAPYLCGTVIEDDDRLLVLDVESIAKSTRNLTR
jgi:positive phototaxis protein PixI